MVAVMILLAMICLCLAFAVIRNGSKLAELEYRLANIERDVQKEDEFLNRSHIPSGIDL